MKPAVLLVILFVISQIVGLHIISQYIDIESSVDAGETVLFEERYLIAPPEITDSSFSFIYIFFSVLIGTALLFVLIKFNLRKIWKAWYALAIFVAILIAIYPYILFFSEYASLFALFIAGILVWLRFKFSQFNILTEILIYGGIAALFVPILNLFSVSLLLILMSLYDFYAVNKSKHMVTMAKFQSESKLFAGFSIGNPKQKTETSKSTYDKTITSAMLGGGDIAFPLLFAGVLLKTTGLFHIAFLPVFGAAVGLSILFYLAKKGNFYPALPPITLGCFLGYFFYIVFF